MNDGVGAVLGNDEIGEVVDAGDSREVDPVFCPGAGDEAEDQLGAESIRIDEDIVASFADQRVVVEAANQGVIAVAALQDVEPGFTAQDVIAGPAFEDVAAR